MFAAAVIERSPVRAVFALPLQWGAVNLGVLDLYRRQPGALNSEQGQDALTTAETAALMIPGSAVGGQMRGLNLRVDLGERACGDEAGVCPRSAGGRARVFVLLRRG